MIDLTIVPDDYIVMHHKTDMAKRLNDKYVVYEVQKEKVPLVRCMDCKYYTSDGGALMMCEISGMIADEDDYCSFGERRG